MTVEDKQQEPDPADYLDLTAVAPDTADKRLFENATTKPDAAEKRLLENAPNKAFNVQESGTGMSRLVIWAIITLAVLLLIAVSWGEFGRPSAEVRHAHAMLEGNLAKLSSVDCTNVPGQCIEAIKQATELVKAANDGRRTAREFWLGFTQLLLINLLLPVLTALLGYVFGTRRTEST